ncbi:type IV pilin N-terminal domain-containing protein [uncultured Methanospirillum sp.]|uniref:type IV pilin N-terminal domain-containing protein n=1 Tax=uncultured Methanospirillum sp. TaxID=262503 RepID=UPI0029C73831|nr:type IV pilin N-terminal domain-containing protein [uncultured Methanospirillum sp.]
MNKKESAVSPVIGVLLMLVVTIIIAAVVSGFAGGLAGSQQKAPQASIDVKFGYGVNDDGTTATNQYDISFSHNGGDLINTKDCQLITFLTLYNGTVVKHIQSASSTVERGAYPMYSRVPHLYDNQKYAFPCDSATKVDAGYENPAWFGKATWAPGDIARTYQIRMTAAFLGLVPEASLYPGDTTAYDAGVEILRGCVENKTPVEIKMLHVPSGKYILDKTINLQG